MKPFRGLKGDLACILTMKDRRKEVNGNVRTINIVDHIGMPFSPNVWNLFLQRLFHGYTSRLVILPGSNSAVHEEVYSLPVL